MSFDSKLLEKILVCTKCRSALVRDGDVLVCITAECRMRFTIQHEIPNMLVEEAAPLSIAEWGPMMHRAGRDPVTGVRLASG
jgi:uncharacterized protein YbaR (Trm112 family)